MRYDPRYRLTLVGSRRYRVLTVNVVPSTILGIRPKSGTMPGCTGVVQSPGSRFTRLASMRAYRDAGRRKMSPIACAASGFDCELASPLIAWMIHERESGQPS